MKHTKKYKKLMSQKKKKWWEELRKNPEKYKKVVNNIGASGRGRLMPNGPKNGNWKGGRFTTKRDGYISIYSPNHPFAKKGGGGTKSKYMLEHRLVMEKMLGRFLLKTEDVNHINGIKDDNRPKNLRLVSHFAHYEEHGCPKCGFKFLTR